MNDLISIIVPVYNVEKYLKDCIESLINQTYANIEIVIINDGSTDGSLKIINKYMESDKRIVLIDRENKGVLFSKVEGYKKATGKYITFVDSDDWIEYDAIEILYKNIIKYKADVIKADYSYNDSKKASGNLARIKGKKIIAKENFEPLFYDMLLKDISINSLCAQMFKKELLSEDISNIDTTIVLGDDLEFNMQLYKNINNILFIDEVLYHYRYNPSSITRRLTEENIKNNIITATKCYYKVYKSIDSLPIKNKIVYKKALISRLVEETSKWQIDLIGVLNNKEKSIEYLKYFYYENDYMQKVKNDIKEIKLDIKNVKYGYFYNYIYKNLNSAYIVGKNTYKFKKIYKVIKEAIKKS